MVRTRFPCRDNRISKMPLSFERYRARPTLKENREVKVTEWRKHGASPNICSKKSLFKLKCKKRTHTIFDLKELQVKLEANILTRM